MQLSLKSAGYGLVLVLLLTVAAWEAACVIPSQQNETHTNVITSSENTTNQPSANAIGSMDYFSREIPYDYTSDLETLPESYSSVINQTELGKYRALLDTLNAKDPGAARWVMGMGQFLEDRAVSDDEIHFVNAVAQTSDPMRTLVAPWARDTVTSDDTAFAKTFNLPSGEYGYLSDDIEKINITQPAEEKLKKIIESSRTDYEIRKGLYIIDEYGTPNPANFKYPVARYNTQLQVLADVLDNPKISSDYYRLALATGIEYGAIQTVGDSEVLINLSDYVRKRVDFAIETDQVIRQKGAPWQVKNYTLEADMALIGPASGTALPIPYDSSEGWTLKNKDSQPSWQIEFRRTRMTIPYFDIVTTSPETLADMRAYMFSKLLPKDIPEFIDSDFAATHNETFIEEHFSKLSSGDTDFQMVSSGDIDTRWKEFRSNGTLRTSYYYDAHGCTLNQNFDKLYIENALSESIGIPAEVGLAMKHGKNALTFSSYPVIYYYDQGRLRLKPSQVKAIQNFNKCSISSRKFTRYGGYLSYNVYLSTIDGAWNNIADYTTVERIYRDGKDMFELKPGTNPNPTTQVLALGVPSAYKYRSNYAVITDVFHDIE